MFIALIDASVSVTRCRHVTEFDDRDISPTAFKLYLGYAYRLIQ